MREKKRTYFLLLLLIACVLFALELALGTVSIPLASVWNSILGNSSGDTAWTIIVMESRLPRALTAAFGAAGLALSGLFMQTLFRNPLAGPSILGISSGASLGVALLVLGAGSLVAMNEWSVALASAAGACTVLFVVLLAARRLNDNVTLLIFGIMLSFIAGAIVSILQYKSSLTSLRNFVVWGMGSFAETTWTSVALLAVTFAGCIAASVFILPSLNILLLGEEYASTMGLHVKKIRVGMILITGILTGTITAFCGPVAFIGLAVPHLARMLYKTSNHSVIFPACLLIGTSVGMLCDLVARSSEVPLNAVTAALGAPLVIYIVFRGSSSRALI